MMTLMVCRRAGGAAQRLPRIAALLVVAAVLAACGTKKAPKQRAAVPVVLAAAHRAPVPYTIAANGIVTPEQTANVSSLVDGVITEVAFREGQEVTKGQKMFQIDRRPYIAAYGQARATLEKDLATLVNDQHEDQRYGQLVKQDYVTQEQADQQHFTYEAQKATVVSDSANLATAKYNLDNSTVVAPVTGRTGILYVRVGNTVHGASGTTLTTINQIHPILVEFAVPATSLSDIQKYSGAGQQLPVMAYEAAVQAQTAPSATPSVPVLPQGDTAAGSAVAPGAAGGGRHRGAGRSGGAPRGAAADTGGPPQLSHRDPGAGAADPDSGGGAQDANGIDQSGTQGGPPGGTMTGVQSTTLPIGPAIDGALTFINNAVDTTTGTVLLKGEFANKDNALWPGEFVAISLQLYIQQDALVVPAAAVSTGQQGQYVYVVDQTATAHQRTVTVDRTFRDLAVVSAGLKEGEEVVSDGQSRLTSNSKVTVRSTAPTTGAPAAGAAPAAARDTTHAHGRRTTPPSH
jgi:multidrug efflux pump subunit AcrA (membrane-fusion protein)